MSKARGPYRVDPLGYKKKSNEALDKKAENARELGLDYEPAQQEPVAWMYQCSADSSGPVLMQHKKDWAESGSGLWTETPLYTSPPAQRKPLTDEEKDAARWRFLVDNSFDKEGITQFHVWEHSWEPHSQTGEPTEWKQRVGGPALDRFIDLAIEAAHGIKENT